MNKLELISVSEVKTEKARKDNKQSRQYFTAEFAAAGSNIFTGGGKTHSRNFFQFHNADGSCKWGALTPEKVSKMVGREFDGEIITAKVNPYQIDGRTVSTTTVVVFEGELLENVVKASGKEMLGTVSTAAKVASIAEEPIN